MSSMLTDKIGHSLPTRCLKKYSATYISNHSTTAVFFFSPTFYLLELIEIFLSDPSLPLMSVEYAPLHDTEFWVSRLGLRGLCRSALSNQP